MTRFATTTLLACLFLGWTQQAVAKGLTCARVEEGSVLADGVTTDWKDISEVTLSNRNDLATANQWSGPSDLSLRIACQYTSKRVFFLIRVKDEYVVRMKRLDERQDHIRLQFKGGKDAVMLFYPPAGRNRAAWGWRRWTRRHKHLKLARPAGGSASLFGLADGYGMEIDLPASALPNYGPGSAALDVTIQAIDIDSKANRAIEAVMTTARGVGRIVFEEADALLKRFLADRGLPPSRIKFNRVANFVTGPSLERAIIVDRILAVMGGDITGGGYFYMTLPVANSRDILRFAARDMDGDGQPELLVRLRQIHGPNSREVFLIYRYRDTGGIGLIFGQEVLHKMPGRILTNKYRYIRHGRGYDMEFWVDRCQGFTQDNHRQPPPRDIQGILTPWSDPKRIRYRFTQAGYQAVTTR